MRLTAPQKRLLQTACDTYRNPCNLIVRHYENPRTVDALLSRKLIRRKRSGGTAIWYTPTKLGWKTSEAAP